MHSETFKRAMFPETVAQYFPSERNEIIYVMLFWLNMRNVAQKPEIVQR